MVLESTPSFSRINLSSSGDISTGGLRGCSLRNVLHRPRTDMQLFASVPLFRISAIPDKESSFSSAFAVVPLAPVLPREQPARNAKIKQRLKPDMILR